ncbi:MAG: hypothetical protein QXE10_02410 [Desulfurococcaceae archaeon]
MRGSKILRVVLVKLLIIIESWRIWRNVAFKVQLKLRRGLSEEEKRDLLEVLEASRKILEMQLT